MGRRDPLDLESASAARAALTRQVCPNSSFRAMLAIAMTLYMSRFDNLGAVGPACLKMETYGTADEEKHACGLSTLFSKEKECVVVSIGSQNLWVFEEAIYQNTSCRIEVFDCTVPGASPPTHIQVLLAWLVWRGSVGKLWLALKADVDGWQGRTTLHHICIGDQDAVINGQTFLSWASITKRIGMTAAPAYVKMDIEGYEYNVL